MMKAKNSIMPVIPIKRRNVLRSIQMKYNYFNPGVNIITNSAYSGLLVRYVLDIYQIYRSSPLSSIVNDYFSLRQALRIKHQKNTVS